MNLSAPTIPLFFVSLIVAVLAIAGTQTAIPFVSDNAFWVAIASYVVLVLGNLLKGL